MILANIPPIHIHHKKFWNEVLGFSLNPPLNFKIYFTCISMTLMTHKKFVPCWVQAHWRTPWSRNDILNIRIDWAYLPSCIWKALSQCRAKPLFLITRPCSINVVNLTPSNCSTYSMLPEIDRRISVNYMYNVWEPESPKRNYVCNEELVMEVLWIAKITHSRGALFPEFCFLNWVISSHHNAASTHTRTYNICSSRCISGTFASCTFDPSYTQH